MSGRAVLFGFVAGFIAVLVFHQGAVWLLGQVGLGTFRPFQMAPVPPLGVPRVLSLAFWGGVWGVLLALVLAGAPRLPALLTGFVLGGIATTLAGFTLVPLLRGQPLPPTPGFERLWRPLLINGVWGWGTALLLLRARLGLRA